MKISIEVWTKFRTGEKTFEDLLTFLGHPEVEPTNNRAERQLRPNVIMRKITPGLSPGQASAIGLSWGQEIIR